MDIKVTRKVIIPEKVTEEIVKEYIECDKCRKIIEDSIWNGSPFYGEIKLSTGHKTIELCKKCTKELEVLLVSNNYRLVEVDF